jgi:methylisocitrate lyase
MTEQIKSTWQLRELLEAPGIIKMPGAHDTLTAVVIEQTGFESVFISGFGASASLYGYPDLSFVSLNEMLGANEFLSLRDKLSKH